MIISEDVKYIGVNDHKIDLFEGQYIVPNGMSYNSYVILDEKIAVVDTVDATFGDDWLKNLEAALVERNPDYLIVHHAEPDHSANILKFTEKYPDAKIVATAKAFEIIKNFFGLDLSEKALIIKDNDELDLGDHKLKFIAAPMVHWPEVVFSYDQKDEILFSADAFGKFGALDVEDEWACEARRYYFGIVGKFGAQVQLVLKKLESIKIKTICPLHGPVISENLNYYLDLYKTWSSYLPESDGIAIAFTSVYGNTKKAVYLLQSELIKNGCPKVAVTDLARCDMAEAVEDAFRYKTLVLATTTHNGDIFPTMKHFLNELVDHNFQNKNIAFIENGSWAPIAAAKMKSMLENCKDMNFCETVVKIKSSLSADNKREITTLARELCK